MTKDNKLTSLEALGKAVLILDLLTADTPQQFHGFGRGEIQGITNTLEDLYEAIRES